MIPCPKCGNQSYKESRQCPEYGGKPVCIRCCMECQYYNPDTLELKCRYYIAHPRRDIAAELVKINQKISYKRYRIDWYYTHNWPKKAASTEVDLKILLREKAEIEKELKNEKTKRAGA